MNSSDPPILYVEDEEGDVFLMRLAMQQAGFPNSLKVALNGIEAIDYLAGNGVFADRNAHPLPGLVLLDLKLPRMNGFEVLEWLRRQPQFARLPVIVYTSSIWDADRDKAFELGATDYVTKKSDINAMTEWLASLTQSFPQSSQ